MTTCDPRRILEVKRAGLSGIWLGAIAISAAAGCGGAAAIQATPPHAGPTTVTPTAAPAEDESTKGAAAPTAQDEAQKKWTALAKELEDHPTDKPFDGAVLEAQLKAVLAVDPKISAARFNLAVLQSKRGDKAGARKAYEAILKDEPRFVPAMENLAALSVAEGNVAGATATYKQIVQADPKNQTSRLALARILQGQNQHEQAIELCRQVLQRKADEIEAFRIMAESYEALGNIPLAELITSRGLKVNKDDPQLHYLTAAILLAKGELAAGLGKLKQVILLKPDWLKPRAQLADIALTYRDFGSAAQQFEAILKLIPNDRAAKLGLAVSYKGLGRYDQAEKLYNDLVSKDAKDFDALWNRAVLYQYNTNEYDKAIHSYQLAKAAAPSGDKQGESIDAKIQAVTTLKANDAARKAREERERKKQEGIAAACAAIAAGKPGNADAIGGEQERIQAAWDLLLVTAVTKIQSGDVAGGDAAARCALGIVPTTPGAGAVACGQLRVNWIQIQDQAGMLTTPQALKDALAVIEEGIKCDPENPDPQLFKQQLEQLIQAQEAAPAADAPPADGGAVAPADGSVPPEGEVKP
jgi:tetratricopeptide (TPR) repeat protein